MRAVIAFVAAAVAVSLNLSPAAANVVHWTGVIAVSSPVPDRLASQFSVGDVAHVTFSYQPDAPNLDSGSDGLYSLSDYDIVAGTYAASAPAGEFAIYPGSDPGSFSSRGYARTNTSYGLVGPVVQSSPTPLVLLSAGIAFGNAFVDPSLPTAEALAGLDGGFNIFFRDETDTSVPFYYVVFRQTSIAVTGDASPPGNSVPEPFTSSLLFIGLLGLLHLKQRHTLLTVH